MSAELQNRQPQQLPGNLRDASQQYQQPTQADYWRQAQAQVTPQSTQSVLEELNAVRAKLPEVEKAFAETHPDYFQATAKLMPNGESPISALVYHHLLLNTVNPEAC